MTQTISKQKRAKYLGVLRETGNPSKSAESIDLLIGDIDTFKRMDKAFAAECAHAEQAAVDAVEEALRRRALSDSKNPNWAKLYLGAKRPAYGPQKHARLQGRKAKKVETPESLAADLPRLSDEELEDLAE